MSVKAGLERKTEFLAVSLSRSVGVRCEFGSESLEKKQSVYGSLSLSTLTLFLYPEPDSNRQVSEDSGV